MKSLTLIDANSLIHRAFHALPTLTTPDGRPVQALYGLSLVLLKMREEGMLDYAAACFDRPEPTFRKEKYDDYKATRPKAPEPLVEQIIEAHRLFEIFGVKTFEKAGYEADDGIATLAERFKREPGVCVTILTGDMDTLQLVEDPVVRVRAFRRGVTDTVVYDEAGVVARCGVRPEQMTSYKALVGDASDNIRGVNGIGPKTAAELIRKFGSLEEIYKHLKDVPEKLRERLKTHETQALLSKELVVLVRDVPFGGDLLAGDAGGADGTDADNVELLKVNCDESWIRGYFEELGFKRLVERLDKKNGEVGAEEKPKQAKEKKKSDSANTNQGSMF